VLYIGVATLFRIFRDLICPSAGSSLNGGLSVGLLNHDSLLIVGLHKHREALLSVTFSVELLSSLHLFVDLLRSFQEVNVHLSVLSHYLTIMAMLLLRESETDRKVKWASSLLHQPLPRHSTLHHRNLHVGILLLLLHVLGCPSTSAHVKARWLNSHATHHHLLPTHGHPSAHHHLIVRVPEPGRCGLLLRLLHHVHGHAEETEGATSESSHGRVLLGHHWRHAPNHGLRGDHAKFVVTVGERAPIFVRAIFTWKI